MSKSKRIKEIKERLTKIIEERHSLLYGEEYKIAKKTFDDVIKKIEKDTEAQRDRLNQEQWDLREELVKLKTTKVKSLPISDRLQDWLKEYKSGIDWGPPSIVISEVLKGERFVIIKNKGHISGTGTVMGSDNYSYEKTRYWIADTYLKGNAYNITRMDENSHIKGVSTRGRITTEVEGRLTKENKKKLLEELENYKKLNNIRRFFK
jgi:hypothetical protein